MNNPGDLLANSYPICATNSIIIDSEKQILPYEYITTRGFSTSIYIVISSMLDSRLKDTYQYVITKDKIHWIVV